MSWLVLLATFASGAVVDRVAAVVNDEVITLSEVYDLGGPFIDERCRSTAQPKQCEREAELEVLDSLILQTLIRQQLQKLSLDVTTDEIDRTIDQIGRENGIEDRETFKAAIETQGVTWGDYREQLTEQIRQMKFNESVLRPRIAVSDDEVRDRYNRTVREFEQPAAYTLEAIGFRVEVPEPDAPQDPGDEPPSDEPPADAPDPTEALVATVARATEVLGQITAGELEWAAAIEAHDTLGRGGKLGTLKLSEMSPAIAKTVEKMKVGDISAPLVMGQLVFLIKPTQKSEPEVQSFDAVQDRIRVAVYEEKIEDELEQWYQVERRQAALRILLEVE